MADSAIVTEIVRRCQLDGGRHCQTQEVEMYIFGPFCAEFVHPKFWHFDNGATSKIADVLAEDGGLLHVLPLPLST